MKHTILLTTLTLSTLILSTGCENKSKSTLCTLFTGIGCDKNSNKASTPSAKGEGIVACSTLNKGFDSATILTKGTTLHGKDSKAKVRLWHLEDGTRKGCVISGSVKAS